MASFFEPKDRNVIPNWRSFENTTKMGEINGLAPIGSNKSFSPDISKIEDDWEMDRNIGIAAELISLGSAFNISSKTIDQASEFVLNNHAKSSKELLRIARTLNNGKKIIEKATLEITNLQVFNDYSNLHQVFSQIRNLKTKLINNPRNVISWVDIARYYSILGQNDQARTAMLNAVYLNPNNRFVLRSMARFFAHNDELDMAHDIIRKQPITKVDPWLIATEISLASIRGRYSVFIKDGLRLLESKQISPFNLSEVSSSIGTLELSNGSHKKSKKLFQFSLIDPNDNALAQAEWASNKNQSINIDVSERCVETNFFEAAARSAYDKKSYKEALLKSIDWFLDLPFSKAPIIWGSHIARTYLDDHEKAIELGRIGLISHPNDVILINNLIYSYCIIGEIQKAEQLLEKHDGDYKTERENICWLATKGLLYFRKGLPDIGRHFYKTAIDQARNYKSRLVFNLAVVNYTREEIRINSEYSDMLINQLDVHLKGEENATVLKVKNEIFEIVKYKDNGK